MESKKTNKDITAENLKKVDELLESIGKMTDEEYGKFLQTCRLFHNYSIGNQILLHLQGATNVKGFKSWQAIGRKVKKGARAIWILAPLTYKVKDESSDSDEYRVAGFKSIPVFDISDTEGDPLPAFSKPSEIKFSDMVTIAEKLGFAIETKALDFAMGGYIDNTGRIVINSVRQECDNVTTIIHEMAHGLLEHHSQPEKNRKLCEHEAETLTYLINSELGIEGDSVAYLKNWSLTESIKKSMKEINTAYNKFFKVYESIQAGA